MLRRILLWLRNRPRRLRGRLAAKAIFAAFPELLTFDPKKELNDFLKWITP